MKIYDKTKTRELEASTLDLKRGSLVADRLTVRHEAILPKEGRTLEEVLAGKAAQDIRIKEFDGRFFEVLRENADGSCDLEEIFAEADISGREAYDEEEEIRVYIPHSSEELKALELAEFRRYRSSKCFPIINRGAVWYDRLTEEQKAELREWYQAWLDVTETRVIPQKPEWLEEL